MPKKYKAQDVPVGQVPVPTPAAIQPAPGVDQNDPTLVTLDLDQEPKPEPQPGPAPQQPEDLYDVFDDPEVAQVPLEVVDIIEVEVAEPDIEFIPDPAAAAAEVAAPKPKEKKRDKPAVILPTVSKRSNRRIKRNPRYFDDEEEPSEQEAEEPAASTHNEVTPENRDKPPTTPTHDGNEEIFSSEADGEFLKKNMFF